MLSQALSVCESFIASTLSPDADVANRIALYYLPLAGLQASEKLERLLLAVKYHEDTSDRLQDRCMMLLHRFNMCVSGPRCVPAHAVLG